MILVIDNYDSFVHNLARYLRRLGCETMVIRNDRITVQGIIEIAPKAIVISPGPCAPDQAGCSLDVIKQLGPTIPILGICLGHQAIVQALGGTIVSANEPVHGRQSSINHANSKMFREIDSPFIAGRYHSLVANTGKVPNELIVTARADDGTIMTVEHASLPIVGLQFHPESILTKCGYQLLINFLKLADIPVTNPANFENEFDAETEGAKWLSPQPISSNRLSKQELP